MHVRVIQDGARDGAANMARDEAMLESVGAGASPPTLRLYQWDPPTISLGYFQNYADYEALPPPAGELAVVRRQTGGGAILHDRELTYSFALPTGHALLEPTPARLYEFVHDALIACLGDAGVKAHRGCETDDSTPTRGPFFCFARRHCLDVLTGPDKLAGSAQRITRDAVLQHGSIIFDRRYAQQPSAAITRWLTVDVDDFTPQWIAALTEITSLPFHPAPWTDAELQLANEFTAKYADDQWTRKR